MRIEYYYRKSAMVTPEAAAQHDEICKLLLRIRTEGRIAEYLVQDAEIAFPTKVREKLFKRLRDFALRHKVGLAQVFGSRRYSFCYLPDQFVLVFDGDQLREVFPCIMGGVGYVEPHEFLRQIGRGGPWTDRSGAGMEGKKHKALVAQIVDNLDSLESGLVVRGHNVQVSRDFGELGFVDLVFQDCKGRALLVEVKAGPRELDKAIGQIMRHRHLFSQQNQIEELSIRIGIACPSIPAHYRSICFGVGVACFEIPEMPVR